MYLSRFNNCSNHRKPKRCAPNTIFGTLYFFLSFFLFFGKYRPPKGGEKAQQQQRKKNSPMQPIPIYSVNASSHPQLTHYYTTPNPIQIDPHPPLATAVTLLIKPYLASPSHRSIHHLLHNPNDGRSLPHLCAQESSCVLGVTASDDDATRCSPSEPQPGVGDGPVELLLGVSDRSGRRRAFRSINDNARGQSITR